MTTDATIRTQCPSCQAKFRVASEHVGRRTRCPGCRQAFEIQPVAQSKSNGPKSNKADAPPEVTYVGVNCRLCGTRMYGRLDQVGKPMKCPDCDTETTLPPPKPTAKQAVPAAMLGEQYELYEGDDQPWGITLAAAQAESVPVHCELCGTLQHVPPEMVGSVAVCPDCDHGTRVHPKPTTAKKDLGPDLELEPPTVTEEMATPTAPPVYSRLHDFESLSDEDKEERMSRVATNRKARPQMPRLPLVTGWGAFLRSPGVVPRWLGLSVWLSGCIALAAFSFTLIFGGGPYGAVAGLPLFCAAGAMLGLWYGCCAAIAMTVITESSEGNDKMTAWPTINPIDWMGEALYMMVAALASAAPGYLLVLVTGAHSIFVLGGMLASAWVFYPIMQLSSLEASSPFALAMPGVLGSLGEWFGTWGRFYILSGLLAVATVVVVGGLGWLSPPLLLVASVPIVGAAGVYFRLLGRLAWRIREDS